MTLTIQKPAPRCFLFVCSFLRSLNHQSSCHKGVDFSCCLSQFRDNLNFAYSSRKLILPHTAEESLGTRREICNASRRYGDCTKKNDSGCMQREEKVNKNQHNKLNEGHLMQRKIFHTSLKGITVV